MQKSILFVPNIASFPSSRSATSTVLPVEETIISFSIVFGVG